jgi:2-oxoglutarate ferredoxin oxidoreductase subunit alpha
MKKIDNIVILLTGTPGDGIQFIVNLFYKSVISYKISTLSNFPAEIKYPDNTINGVSSCKINIGQDHQGDQSDILIVMNASCLKKKLSNLKKCGIIIANSKGFCTKKLKLSKYDNLNFLKFFYDYIIYDLGINKEIIKLNKTKTYITMFILGLLYYILNLSIIDTIKNLKKIYPAYRCANIMMLKRGYLFGNKKNVDKYFIKKKLKYKISSIILNGNKSIVFGLLASAHKAKLNLFYSGYPITPASDILHYFSNYNKFGVKTFQAEDEIAAITSAIGASYAGHLGVTATSGPGLSLKQEGLGLALMLELPLVIINVQRGGPSTGLPTQTEQADLFQAIYGRNGEAPIPVLAVKSPSNAFNISFNAAKIAIEHMTPVIILSDYYLANGTELIKIQYYKNLEKISPTYPTNNNYYPYKRNKKLVRKWARPGMAGYEKCLGGLEKEDATGLISYDSDNHHKMVLLRQKKINYIINDYKKKNIRYGNIYGDIVIISWGSTYGVIKNALKELLKENIKVSHIHLEYIYPLDPQIGYILLNYKKILIPELNNCQLIHLIRDYFLINAIPFNKIKGLPFLKIEIINKVKNILFKFIF